MNKITSRKIPELIDGAVPDEVILQPDDYDLPELYPEFARKQLEKMKQPVKVTRRQIKYFGEIGAPWTDIEGFYGVHRHTLKRHYGVDYEKGYASANMAYRDRMHYWAMSDNPKAAITALIWVGKNRLGMSDQGQKTDEAEASAQTTDPREVIVVRPTKEDM